VLIVLVLGVALLGVAVACVARAIAIPRLRAMERVGHIGAYGFHVEAGAEPEAGHLTAGLERIATAVGRFTAGRLGGLSEAEMRRELMRAGLYRFSPVSLAGYRVLAAITFPIAFLWFASSVGMGGAMVVLCTPLMLVFGWLGPITVVRRRARARLERIDLELPELVDLLVVTIEAGTGFNGSMQIASERFSGPLGDELRLTMQEQAMGLTAEQALGHLLDRAETDGMRSFVRSIRQGESLGVSIGEIMRTLGVEMRKRRRASAEERAQKAPIKLLFPLAGLIFPAIFVVLLGPAVLNLANAFGGGS
jgi:tight adherence protein C